MQTNPITIKQVAAGVLRANCYIIEGNYQNENFVLVVDPGGNPEKIQKQITNAPTHFVLTHAHFDHMGALYDFSQMYPNAKICVGEKEDTSEEMTILIAKVALGDKYFSRINLSRFAFKIPRVDIKLKDGDDFLGFKIIHTPGHTSGSICLYNESEKLIFTGDTLFHGGYGTTELPTGNKDDMLKSFQKLKQLDKATVVYPGHNSPTTIGNEYEILNQTEV